jgi:hypothetical protein
MSLGQLGYASADMALSISYDPKRALTCALLHGLARSQQAFVRKQIKALGMLAIHPLLLPVALLGYQLDDREATLRTLMWKITDLELAGRQSDLILIPAARHYQQHHQRHKGTLTKGILEVIQFVAMEEAYTKPVILSIESLLEQLSRIRTMAPDSLKDTMQSDCDTITDWLSFLLTKHRVMLCEVESAGKRAQAQMTAVSRAPEPYKSSGLKLTLLGLQLYGATGCQAKSGSRSRLETACCRLATG